MRYPGSHRHERTVRGLTLALALGLFVIGLQAATHKNDRLQAQQRAQTVVSPTPIATPSFMSLATLQLYDAKTGELLRGQSVAILVTVPCPEGSPCPASTPLVVGADNEGKIRVEQSLIMQQPKLYVAGYKLDNYFAFFEPDKPTELTLYKPAPNAKLSYDIAQEEVPVWLIPVE